MGTQSERRKYIETPERFWELFTQYKEWVANNPILIEDYVGKDAERVLRQKPRALTMEGFENFVCEHTKITYPDLTNYFEGKIESYANYLPISSRIRNEIRQSQLEGGLAMVFSQTLTARINGLADKKEVDRKESLNIPKLPDIGARK